VGFFGPPNANEAPAGFLRTSGELQTFFFGVGRRVINVSLWGEGRLASDCQTEPALFDQERSWLQISKAVDKVKTSKQHVKFYYFDCVRGFGQDLIRGGIQCNGDSAV
jgi:hypothetical protein